MHLARILVAADSVLAERHELLGADVVGAQLDEGDDLLAVQLVGTTDDAGGCNRRVLEQRLLDVAREDVEAAADDQVLLPVDDAKVAVGVEEAEIAGVQPTVAEHLGQ